jgi:hypothetical protein
MEIEPIFLGCPVSELKKSVFVKPRSIRWAMCVVRMEEINGYKVFLGKGRD